ncbi:MAG: hypothetical protein J6A90_02920 [Clostridia bacterium]|nr:hypothetical protein [Clostridia bacterium]
MNTIGRKKVADIIERLEIIKDEIENLDDEEWEKYNNFPENLRNSEIFSRFEETTFNLDEAMTYCDDLLEALQNVISI